MERTTVCKLEVLKCLKDKISKARNVEEIEQLIEKDKLPKAFEPSKEEIEKDQRRRACNRKSALHSRERQKKEYKENRKRLTELKEYNADIKEKFKRMKHNKDQFMTLLSAWLTEKDIQTTLDTKLQTESFDFLLKPDSSRDQCSAQSSTSGNDLSTDSDSVAATCEEENGEGSSDGFDALSDRMQSCTDEQQPLVTESVQNNEPETEYIQYTVIQASEVHPDAYTYGAAVSLISLGGDQFMLVNVDDTNGVDCKSKIGNTDSESHVIHVMSDGTIYTQ